MAEKAGHSGMPPEVAPTLTADDGDAPEVMETLGYDDGADPDDTYGVDPTGGEEDASSPDPEGEEDAVAGVADDSASPDDGDTADGDAEGSAPTDESAPDDAESASTAPEWLPEGYEWDTLDAGQKLLLHHAYEKGEAAESAKLTETDRAVLNRYRELEKQTSDLQPAAANQPDLPKITAPEFQVPEDYKDDPAYNALVGQFNEYATENSKFVNALVGQAWKQQQAHEQLSTGHQGMAVNDAWSQFTQKHNDIDETVHAAMTEAMGYIDKTLPVEQQWDASYRFATAGRSEKKPSENKKQADDIARGRRIRATQAASGSGGRRTSGRSAAVETEAGSSDDFLGTYRAERDAGLLPSQK